MLPKNVEVQILRSRLSVISHNYLGLPEACKGSAISNDLLKKIVNKW